MSDPGNASGRYDIESTLVEEREKALTPKGMELAQKYYLAMVEDPRKTALKVGLRQLRPNELWRLIAHVDDGRPVLLDRDEQGRANFDGQTFCPLAIAVGCADMIEMFDSDEEVTRLLTERYGFKIYNTRGIAGEFYTDMRRRDLMTAVREVLAEKASP